MGVLDAGFWYLEDSRSSLHIGSVTIFDGPPPAFEEFSDTIARKLPSLPRYRMRMRGVPLGIARPVWIDDVAFDLGYHVRRTALPAPGGIAQLHSLVDRVMSTRLDADHPLWEAWFVEGMHDGQWAVIWKMHHSMVDGVGGMGLLSTVLDAAPDALPPPLTPWHARQEPSTAKIVGAALSDQARAAASSLRDAVGMLRRPGPSAHAAGGLVQGLARYARAARPVPATSLIGAIDRSRHFTWTSVSLDEVRLVRRAFGGSVNDVVLATVTSGLRDLMIERGETPHPHSVRCLVPVSVRPSSAPQNQGNRVSAMLADLPVHLDVPSTMYAAVVAQTQQLKSSHEAEAGDLTVHVAEYLPTPLVATSLRSVFRLPQRWVTTVVTNVPGPRWPLYLLGRRMSAMYPYVPIADRLRIGVAVTSYDGQLFFGVTSDRDSVPAVGALTDGIRTGLNALLQEAVVASGAG